MLKIRIIPILTFNGFALVKTRKFQNPRMVGNPVQAARVYNSRGVDELVFVDIFASRQNRKLNLKIAREVINECYMPVCLGGGIESLQDINDLLHIGADKVLIKRKALTDPNFIYEAAKFFGSQCMALAVDVVKMEDKYQIFNDEGIKETLTEHIQKIQNMGAGEIILSSVDRDGMMNGFDIEMIIEALKITKVPLVVVGGGGNLKHYVELFTQTNCHAVGSASIFHFTQFTPLDIKNELKKLGKLVRI
jgi:imidazole glycerol-phosphate synthase subunit HisF